MTLEEAIELLKKTRSNGPTPKEVVLWAIDNNKILELEAAFPAFPPTDAIQIQNARQTLSRLLTILTAQQKTRLQAMSAEELEQFITSCHASYWLEHRMVFDIIITHKKPSLLGVLLRQIKQQTTANSMENSPIIFTLLKKHLSRINPLGVLFDTGLGPEYIAEIFMLEPRTTMKKLHFLGLPADFFPRFIAGVGADHFFTTYQHIDPPLDMTVEIKWINAMIPHLSPPHLFTEWFVSAVLFYSCKRDDEGGMVQPLGAYQRSCQAADIATTFVAAICKYPEIAQNHSAAVEQIRRTYMGYQQLRARLDEFSVRITTIDAINQRYPTDYYETLIKNARCFYNILHYLQTKFLTEAKEYEHLPQSAPWVRYQQRLDHYIALHLTIKANLTDPRLPTIIANKIDELNTGASKPDGRKILFFWDISKARYQDLINKLASTPRQTLVHRFAEIEHKITAWAQLHETVHTTRVLADRLGLLPNAPPRPRYHQWTAEQWIAGNEPSTTNNTL